MDTADLYLIYTFITARKQSLRRLCFHVCLSFHGGRAWRGRGQGAMRRRGHAWVVGGVHAKGGGVRGRRDGNCSRWYASYWNAFLFYLMSQLFTHFEEHRFSTKTKNGIFEKMSRHTRFHWNMSKCWFRYDTNFPFSNHRFAVFVANIIRQVIS